MSSHHFVKEDQEPALLIRDPHAISFEKIQELLEWSPTVIVLEEALATILGWEIKIDLVLCIADHVAVLQKELLSQAPIQFISISKENESLDAALRYLADAKYKAVNILVSNKESFETVTKISGIYSELYFENKKWSLVKSGHFQKWLPKQTQLFIHPKKLYMLKGLSNEFESFGDGQITIESDSAFWVGEELN